MSCSHPRLFALSDKGNLYLVKHAPAVHHGRMDEDLVEDPMCDCPVEHFVDRLTHVALRSNDGPLMDAAVTEIVRAARLQARRGGEAASAGLTYERPPSNSGS